MRHPRLPAALLLTALLTASCSSPQAPDAAPASPSSSAAQPSAPAPTPAPSTEPTSAPSATPSSAPSGATAAAGATMTISGFEYVVPASVRPGEQVTVVNQDREAHTVTIDGGAVRLTVLPGETAVFPAPDEPGPHPVVCDLHGGMDAVLVVA